MNEVKTGLDEFVGLLVQFGNTLVEHSPRILGALLFLLVGWYLARFASTATKRLLRSFNAVLHRRWHSRFGTDARLSPTVIGTSAAIIRWTLIFFVLVGASRILGLEILSVWLGQAADQLPSVIAGGIIVFVGVVLSRFARDIVDIALRPTAGTQAVVFGRLTQVMVVAVALVMGVGQAGIDTTLLVSIVTILLAGLFGGMSIAFGLGAKDLVANVIGIHHARNLFVVGQVVRVGDYQGEITRLTPTMTILNTPEGRVTVPGAIFQREAVLLADAPEASDE